MCYGLSIKESSIFKRNGTPSLSYVTILKSFLLGTTNSEQKNSLVWAGQARLSWFKPFCQFSPQKRSPVQKYIFLWDVATVLIFQVLNDTSARN